MGNHENVMLHRAKMRAWRYLNELRAPSSLWWSRIDRSWMVRSADPRTPEAWQRPEGCRIGIDPEEAASNIARVVNRIDFETPIPRQVAFGA